MAAFLDLSEHLRWQFLGIALTLLASILFFIRERHKPAVILLFTGAFALRLVMTQIHPYLNEWDERFHALVAKNFLNHPLKPTLYDNPAVAYHYTSWTTNHVWLHKPPLAMWQIAFTYAMFGVSLFATRLPSAIMGSLLTLLIYRMGVITVGKKQAYLAALFYSCAYFSLDFVTGWQMSDHVDMALFFYITASLWAWLEYNRSKKLYWIVIIGALAGMAVLAKWLTGLLVFAGWGVTILTDKNERESLRGWLHLGLSFLVSLLVFLPWYIFTFYAYPREARYEMEFNRKHVFEVVEGHGGEMTYYLDRLADNYGFLVPFLILPALYFLWKQIKVRSNRIFLLTVLAFTYFFFSVIVQTKMPGFAHITLSVVYLALGCLAYVLYENSGIYAKRWNTLLTCTLLLGICILSLDFKKIKDQSTSRPGDFYRNNKLHLTSTGKTLNKRLSEDYVILGAPPNSEIDLMFWTGNPVYDFYLPDEELMKVKAKGFKIAAFDSPKMPESYRRDSTILILDKH